jgi:VanZ family protein
MIASLQPLRPKTHHWKVHHLLHIACFVLLAGMGQAAMKDRKRLPLVLLACIGFGGVLELSQCLIYRSAFEWYDWRDDTIGSAAGVTVGLLAGL